MLSTPGRGRGNRPIARARAPSSRGRGGSQRGFAPRGRASFPANPSLLARQPVGNGPSGGENAGGFSTPSKRFGVLENGVGNPQMDPSNMNDHLATLKKNRERERAHAIANNLVDDTNKQRRLEDAITFTGTCQDMCPAFERVERIVQKAVDGCEKVALPDGQEVARQELMVKRFRRSAAGDEAQLPSDVRPPPILKATLDYLINDVVGGPKPLAKTHAFLWDRTRSIRNDFSIQNVQGSKNPDLLLAIECYERIARFHIHALHDFARPDVADSGFTAHNEREQLNKTLLSLMEFYDLCAVRGLKCPNEPELRAYNIIMHFHDQDVEREAMNLGRKRPELYDHPRIQKALELYAAAGNIGDLHGPLKPNGPNSIAQNHFARFFRLIASNQISYTMACVAEIHFNHIRKNALATIRTGYRSPGTMQDCTLAYLTDMLGFDNQTQTWMFCQACGMEVDKGKDGEPYLVLNSGKDPLSNPESLKQPFSMKVVERKRHGRTPPHVVNGLTVRQARATGQTMQDSSLAPATKTPFAFSASGGPSNLGGPSLGQGQTAPPTSSATTAPFTFGAPSQPQQPPPATNPFKFGAPSAPVSAPSSSATFVFGAPTPTAAEKPATGTNPFAFGAPSVAPPTGSNPFTFGVPSGPPATGNNATTSTPSFGASSAVSNENKPLGGAAPFTFNSSSFFTKENQAPTPAISTAIPSSFDFGASNATTQTKGDSSPMFMFSAPTAPAGENKPPLPKNSGSKSSALKPSSTAPAGNSTLAMPSFAVPAFNFGSTNSTAATNDSKAAAPSAPPAMPTFSFGAPRTAAPAGDGPKTPAPASAPSLPSFNFGGPNAAAATDKSTKAPEPASDLPAFKFGAPSILDAAKSTKAESKPLSFGAPSASSQPTAAPAKEKEPTPTQPSSVFGAPSGSNGKMEASPFGKRVSFAEPANATKKEDAPSPYPDTSDGPSVLAAAAKSTLPSSFSFSSPKTSILKPTTKANADTSTPNKLFAQLGGRVPADSTKENDSPQPSQFGLGNLTSSKPPSLSSGQSEATTMASNGFMLTPALGSVGAGSSTTKSNGPVFDFAKAEEEPAQASKKRKSDSLFVTDDSDEDDSEESNPDRSPSPPPAPVSLPPQQKALPTLSFQTGQVANAEKSIPPSTSPQRPLPSFKPVTPTQSPAKSTTPTKTPPAALAPRDATSKPVTPTKPPLPTELTAKGRAVPEEVAEWYLLDQGGLMGSFLLYNLPEVIADAYDLHQEETAIEFRRRKIMERFFRRWRWAARSKSIVGLGKKSRQRMRQLIGQTNQRKRRSESESQMSESARSSVEPSTVAEQRASVRFADPGQKHNQSIIGPPSKRLKHATSLPNANATYRRSARLQTPLRKSILMSSINSSGRPTPQKPTPSEEKENVETPSEHRARIDPESYDHTMSNLSPFFLSGRSVMSPHVLKKARSVIGGSSTNDRRIGDTIQSDYWRLKAAGLQTLSNGVTQPISMGSESGSDAGRKAGRKRALDESDAVADSGRAKRRAPDLPTTPTRTQPSRRPASTGGRITNGHISKPQATPTPAGRLDLFEPRHKPTGIITIDLTSDDDDGQEGAESAPPRARDEDEALFEELRSLRSQMDEGIEFYRDAVGGEPTAAERVEAAERERERLPRSRVTRRGWVDE